MGRPAVSAPPARPKRDPTPLAITGVGLATSVGSSALASFVALRAGIARFTEVPGFVLSGGAEPRPAVAARSPLTARTADGSGRAVRLLTAAATDTLVMFNPRRWDLMVGSGLGTSAELVQDGLPTPPSRTTVSELPPGGGLVHIGPLDALIRLAERGLPEGEAVALATVDSLATDSALARFAALGRLKGPRAPVASSRAKRRASSSSNGRTTPARPADLPSPSSRHGGAERSRPRSGDPSPPVQRDSRTHSPTPSVACRRGPRSTSPSST